MSNNDGWAEVGSSTDSATKTYTSSEVSESILLSIKKTLGISPEDEAFDVDIMMHINSAFSELAQLGVGPDDVFMIEDASSTWDEFLEDENKLNLVKSWMWLEVRLMFDPPTASVLSAMERKRDEYEWRLNVAGDKPIDRTDQNGTNAID